MAVDKHDQTIEIIDFPETKVAVLEHKGSPNRVMQTVAKFIQWRKDNGSSPKISDTFNILYDDPNSVEPENYRFDVCASITAPVKPNRFSVIEKVIPSGKCAVLRHVGSERSLGQSIQTLYSHCTEHSNYSLRNFPCFIKRVAFYPDVPEHEMIIDIYLPIK